MSIIDTIAMPDPEFTDSSDTDLGSSDSYSEGDIGHGEVIDQCICSGKGSTLVCSSAICGNMGQQAGLGEVVRGSAA